MCPVREIATTLEGGQVKLEVYVSSFPLLTGNQLHWYRPNGDEIFSTEPNVQFANSRKSLILSNVQLADSGRYEAEGRLTSGSITIKKQRAGITLDIQGLYYPYIHHKINWCTFFSGAIFELVYFYHGFSLITHTQFLQKYRHNQSTRPPY